MLDKITLAIDKHDVISFDIFDTLLVRPYVNPYDMFVHGVISDFANNGEN
jgi:hypothetical protein